MQVTLSSHRPSRRADARTLGGRAEGRLRQDAHLATECLERKDPLDRTDTAGAELRARLPAQLLERLVERTRRAVDARRQHRVESVGDVDDAGAERDLLAPPAVRGAR